jgi:hypothetical protein
VSDPRTELEPVSATEQRNVLAALYDPDMDFRKLVTDAAETTYGFRLVSKQALEGIPFVVLRVIYRPGFPRGDAKIEGDYVSVECVVADQEILDDPVIQQGIPTDARNPDGSLMVYGNEPVIFNDSGTGIRRKLTQIFESFSLINPGRSSVPEENVYDRQFQLWESGADLAQDGFTARESLNHKAIVRALRGLKKSEYDSPYGPAVTWYFG